MSQQNPTPQQPGQPGGPQWGQPGPYGQQPGWGAPQPPKKSGAGKKIGIGCLGFVVLIVIIGVVAGIAGSGGDDNASTTPSHSVPAAPDAKDSKTPAKKKAPAKPDLSTADQFKQFVAKEGLPTEKTAIKHVTKVQGVGDENDILDTAEVYTDFTGDLVGPDADQAKLIASAFADWQHSKNGLVTIYNKTGDILSNGNY